MADRKISDLTALTTPASGDYLPIVDISEASAANKNKRITIEELLRGAPDGTAGAPGIGFESDPNTGIYSPGADALGLVTAGTERARIDSSGRVGIGTTSPVDTLQVNRNSTSAAAGAITIKTADSNESFLSVGVSTSLDTAFISSLQNGTGTARPISFVVGSSSSNERMRIDTSGRLLVGTSSTSIASTAILQGRSDNATEGAVLRLARGLNNPADGSSLSALSFTDSGHTNAALIAAVRDGGTWTSGTSQPTRLVFSVTADGASSPTEALRISNNRAITVSDGGNVVLGTTTGTKIGTATTQKLGFYNATPVVQPAAVADATDAATVITQLNDLLAKLRTLGIIAT